MKVAVAAAGRDLDAQTDPRFGRCQYFVIVETDDMSLEALDNTAAMQGSGAGIAAVQLVANAGAEAVIASNLGPNAFGALNAGGLKVYSFEGGTVGQAVTALQSGLLAPIGNANVPSHFGTGGGGGGGGRGMGGGGGRGMNAAPPPAPATGDVRKQVESLEAQLADLRQQLDRLSGQDK